MSGITFAYVNVNHQILDLYQHATFFLWQRTTTFTWSIQIRLPTFGVYAGMA